MNCYLTTNSLVDATGTRSCYIKKSGLWNWIKQADILQRIFNFNALLSLSVLHVPSSLFELPTTKFARYNRIICQRVENTSFFERLSCILHALAKGYQGYQGYKSNFGFHVPFDREIWQIQDQKSVFGFAERNTPQVQYHLQDRLVLNQQRENVFDLVLKGFSNSLICSLQGPAHQALLCNMGAVNALMPLLVCDIPKIQQPALLCYSAMSFQNGAVSLAMKSGMFYFSFKMIM